MVPSNTNSLQLGATDIQIPRMGLGVWAWGDTFIWDYGKDFNRDDVDQAFAASVAGGLTLIDTAEIYGFGRSERILGELLNRSSAEFQIATKFMPYPWRLCSGQLNKALRGSLRRLNLDRVALYQIHQPLPFRTQATWLNAMADKQREGIIGAVGISNFNLDQTQSAIETLAGHQLPLASNQVKYSLMDRSIEHTGLRQLCQDENVTIIAYSPLAQGLLTGKYSAGNPPPGARGRQITKKTWQRLDPLLQSMERIGQAHGGRTPAQVALNWVMAKGAVPIPGAKNRGQAQDNVSALEWQLTSDEVAELDQLSN